MREINLTQSAVALVDDDDYERLSKYNWFFARGYAYRTGIGANGKRTSISMHREIVDIRPGYECDHINGNRFDNRKANLRQATHTQNLANQKAQVCCTSRFKGVSRDRTRWQAQIAINNKSQYLGRFIRETDAALAYNDAASNLFGEFARLNVIPEDTADGY